MGKVSAHGGYWVAAQSDADGNELTARAIVHNAECEVDTESMIDDTTDSGSGGVAEGLPIIVKVNSLTMSVAEDDVSYPQALGLLEGQIMKIWLKRGATSQFDLVAGTIVRNIRTVNDQTKARRVNITCEYGNLFRNVAPPI